MEQVKENIVIVTPDNFQAEVLECEKPVLVTFYANWDQPCRMQQPALDSIADRHPEIKVCKLDVEEHAAFAQQFGIMMIPTTIIGIISPHSPKYSSTTGSMAGSIMKLAIRVSI